MILGLTPAGLALLLGIALAGGLVRGLAGFGLAILLVPIAALAIPPAEAVAMAQLLGLLLGLTEMRRMALHAEHTARTIALLALLATPLGLAGIAAIPVALGRLLLAGVASLAFVAVLLPQRPHHAPGPVATGLVGMASGLLNGFAGMPGPPIAPYYLGRRIAPQVARASMMLIFLATSISGVASGWLLLDVAGWRTFWLGLALFPGVMLGNWLGAQAFGRTSPAAWRWFTGAVLAAAALSALIKLV